MLDEQRHSYQKQLALLQDDIIAKETQIAQITEQYRAQVRVGEGVSWFCEQETREEG